MEISKRIGGFTPGQADDLRKAIGKKIKAKMDQLEPKFREGAAATGTAPRVIDHLWSLMEKAGDYSFNKSHAACYALISYRTAYLKANHPGAVHGGPHLQRHGHQGQGALLRDGGQRDGHRGAAARHQRVGARLPRGRGAHPLRPERGQERGRDRHPQHPRGPEARTGPSATCSTSASGSTWAWSTGGPSRACVKSGAMDSIGPSRRGMLLVLPQAMAHGKKIRSDADRGQGSIFDLLMEPASGDERAGARAPTARVRNGSARRWRSPGTTSARKSFWLWRRRRWACT